MLMGCWQTERYVGRKICTALAEVADNGEYPLEDLIKGSQWAFLFRHPNQLQKLTDGFAPGRLDLLSSQLSTASSLEFHSPR